MFLTFEPEGEMQTSVEEMLTSHGQVWISLGWKLSVAFTVLQNLCGLVV